MKRIIISLMTLLLVVPLILGLALPAAAQVDPPEVIADLEPGESMTVEKVVETPPIPPIPDIYFMSDTTGSMGPAIDEVGNNADAILATIAALDPTAQFGVGNYKDYPYDPLPPFYHQQSITDDMTAVSAAINDWSAGGGWDGPEGQFYALTQIATDPAIGWRDGSTRIVVWFGDAPAHDPVPDAATGLGYDITEDTVTQALVDAEIRVIAISLDTGYYEDGLNDDPTDAGGDYASEYGITENGTPGQASRIAAATDGVYLFAATPEEVVDAILEGLSNLPITVTPVVVEPCDYLEITFDPTSQTVTSGEMAYFDETITVSLDAPQCQTVCCTIQFIDEFGNVLGEQTVCIHVLDVTPPEVWCIESVNPHGKNVPPAGKTTLPGPKGGQNEDGFYQLCATDNCDEPEEIEIWVSGFGPFKNGDVVKISEAPGATPSMKKMGSTNGQAGAVTAHIILPTDPVITAVDTSGNIGTCICCLVPPPPK